MGDMFSTIQNPETGNWVNINGLVGKKVLKNYVLQSGGRMHFGSHPSKKTGNKLSVKGIKMPMNPRHNSVAKPADPKTLDSILNILDPDGNDIISRDELMKALPQAYILGNLFSSIVSNNPKST